VRFWVTKRQYSAICLDDADSRRHFVRTGDTAPFAARSPTRPPCGQASRSPA
jgi:hypothetical protein